jgi:uncharacterized membrane protein YidH (DUF202 family)
MPDLVILFRARTVVAIKFSSAWVIFPDPFETPTRRHRMNAVIVALIMLVMAGGSVVFFRAAEAVGPYKKSGDVYLALSYGMMVGFFTFILSVVAHVTS